MRIPHWKSASTDTSNNPDLVLAYCTVMLRKNDTAGAIKQAERLLLSKATFPQRAVADLSFALGNLYEKNGNYSRAFQYFEAANRASPCTYSHEKHIRYINSIIRSTEKETLARIPRARHIVQGGRFHCRHATLGNQPDRANPGKSS